MPKTFAIRDPATFFANFPKLPRTLKATSEATDDYICFSLAVGDDKRVWAPEEYCWWPPGVPRTRSVSSFVKLLKQFGFEKCDNGKFEKGVRKAAIYAVSGTVKHIAVQPPDKNGRWHSKMGTNVNLMHDLEDLCGEMYGEVVQIMRQRKPAPVRRALARAKLNF